MRDEKPHKSHPITPLTYREALERLTPREIEVLKLVWKQFTNKEIAQKLHLSVRTVQTHRHTICKKCNLKGRHALAKWLWWVNNVKK
jgi:DNA-binding NarL/FixJ family response regulator